MKYSAQEWTTILQDILDEIESDPTKAALWTDRSPGSPGILLLELIAYLGDMLSHSLDYRTSELYLLTARLAESVLRIAKSEGYRIRGPNAALCEVAMDFTAGGAPFGVAVTLPEISKSVGGVDWYYAGGDILAAGSTTITVTFTQAVKLALSSTGTNGDYQRVSIGTAKVPFSSVAVLVDAVAWEDVAAIALAGYQVRAFELFYDETAAVQVQFGNGFTGRKPGDGAVISISWLQTEGQGGNLGANVWLNEQVSFFSSEVGTVISADTDNSNAAAGGLDAATTDDIRTGLIAWKRALDVGVTPDALQALTLAFSDPTYGAVTKASAIVLHANTYANLIGIYVASASGTYVLQPAVAALKAALLVFLNLRKIITVELQILDPVLVPVNMVLDVRPVLGASATVVEAAVEAAIQTVFTVDAIEIGTPIYLSDLYRVVELVEDVDWCLFTTPTGNTVVDATLGEVPQLGTVAITIV